MPPPICRLTIKGLSDGTYTLTESQAPLGFKTAETITFEIKEGKLVESENVKADTVTMKDEQYSTDIKVSKTAVGGGKELTGAKLTVKMVKTAADETVDKFIDSWISNGSSHELTGLKDGTYTLTEDQAPLGYQTAESITFEIKEGKLVESENAGDGTVTMKDEQYKTDIKVSKTAVGGGEELPGAKLTVKMVKTADGQAADELIENWISDGTVHEIQNLLDGTYTLTEDQAPLGYKTAESITFIIQEGKLIGSVHVRDGVVVMQDEQYKTDIKVSKVAAGGGEELPGAELTVKDEKGGTVASWTSDGTIHEIKDLIDGTYTLTENQAPLGYQKAESITFEIKDGKLVESEAAKDGIITMEDAQYKGGVSINKISLGQGAELSGAKLTVKDSKDNVIASWISDGTNHEISDLVDGTYTLTEDQAPLGYKKAESITFEMKEGKLVDGSHAQNGVVTMEDEQYKTDIKVSKVAAGGGEELPGAELTVKMVKNADGTAIEGGKLIDDWTSSGSAHEIAGLADGTYTLTEDQAPLGYKTAETITFEIKEGKLVESENAKDGIVTMEDKQYKTDIQVSKVAAGGGEELPGAELSVKMVKNAGGEEVEEEIDRWTSDGSKHEIKDLADGTYTLTEDQAPLGYKTAETITFEIKGGALFESENAKNGIVTMEDKQYKTDIQVSKVAAGGGAELPGADLTVKMVKNADGEEVEEEIASWTSDGSKHEIKGLVDGTYTLTEDQAPLGYKTAETITFEIKGSALVESENAKNGIVTMEDKQYKTDIKVSKVAAGGGEELPGAELTVKNEKGDIVASWTSDGTVHEIKDLTDGTYTLTEDQAPRGYQKAESITFEIKKGKLVESEAVKDGVVTMEDAQYKGGVSINKVSLGQGTELPGAKLTVKDSEGNVIDSWTSDGTNHEIKDLADGTYTLTEDQAPLGYKKAESITFEMKEGKLVRGEHAKDGVVTMEDEQYKTNIGVSKVAAGGGEELPGAELKVENAEGVLIDIWQSNGSTHVITDLVDGTYTLTENQAPLGYLKAESITFEIKEGKLIESANAKDGVVTITDSRTKGKRLKTGRLVE